MILKQRKSMPKNEKEISATQQKRLRHIEHLAFFNGMLTREDIRNKFSISAATATNDLSAYNQKAPDNLTYNVQLKCYQISKSFAPVFDIYNLTDRLPIYTLPKLHKPADEEIIKKIALISRAIHNVQVLKITYSSASSGTTTRKIIPVAFADNLLRWHLRAYDRKRRKHIDFVVNRIGNVESIEKDTIQPHEHPDRDSQWHSFVQLKIKTHPHNSTNSQHFDMRDKARVINVRSAMAGYFLELWNVDCSPSASLRGKKYHYVLENSKEISRIANLELAPGYKNDEK